MRKDGKTITRPLKCPDCGTTGARLMSGISRNGKYPVECFDKRCDRAWFSSHRSIVRVAKMLGGYPREVTS